MAMMIDSFDHPKRNQMHGGGGPIAVFLVSDNHCSTEEVTTT
jgi:hypothetical protein